MHTKLLFILKKRSKYGVSYGLVNSCHFIQDALSQYGIESKVVEVVDNNDIDKEVTQFQPTHVLIEALWVVPSKFDTLIKLHPKVKWIVRLHSQVPFLGTEGVAFEWLRGYHELTKKHKTFSIASNNSRFVEDIRGSLGYDLQYLPNIYLGEKMKKKFIEDDSVHIGCFGAIRPFKNHLEQALGAMNFANRVGKRLHFHINASRFENVGDAILKNLRSMFDGSPYHLVEHDWVTHEQFLDLVRQMDLGLQVSFTETFNIVAADFVVNNIPVVGSPEIDWLFAAYQANPTDSFDISDRLLFAWKMRKFNFQYFNQYGLDKFNYQAIKVWQSYLS
jgi:hypothetical protein